MTTTLPMSSGLQPNGIDLRPRHPGTSIPSRDTNPERFSASSAAIERVLTRFANTLRADARARGLSPADIDELLQDIRVRLWKTGASDETLDGLGTSYLKRVAMSAAVDMLRRRRARREESLEAFDGAPEIPKPLQVAAPDRSDVDELAQRLDRALAQLARNRRIVVQLHLEGYHREEMATLTGWTEGKVRNLLYRGLDELRAALRDDGSVT